MDVAAELMYLRGVRATGIREIIDAAAAGKSQLYHYFEAKDDLAAAVLKVMSGTMNRPHGAAAARLAPSVALVRLSPVVALCRPCALRFASWGEYPRDGDRQDAQCQVDRVVEDAVFAGEETKRVGFSEADRADQ